MSTQAEAGAEAGTAPARAPLVLVALIAVAGVANINLAVANVALPSIGDAFDASQSQLNLIAVGYSLGLAASVLYLGAVGDRYGRKSLLLLGTAIAMPASVLAAYAPDPGALAAARLLGGVAAGMAYPTTLALITALWSGAGRTRAIALWSAIGGALSAVGPLVAGFLLERFWWGSVFLFTLPLAAAALVLAWWLVPAHVNETTDDVDHLGGVLSVVLIGSIVLSITVVTVPGLAAAAAVLLGLGVAAGLLFVRRQRRAANPIYDLDVAARPTFWVAAVAGIIVFGSLMGAMYIGQQFLQNVLGYDPVSSGAAVLPLALLMVLVAPTSARLVERVGSRTTLLAGFAFVLLGFVAMLVLWTVQSSYWQVGLAYALMGIGVGIAGTPASHSLTSSVPVRRVGMASGTADLQRDFGGALLQSTFGALLTAGYAASVNAAISGAPPSTQQEISEGIRNELTKSYAGAEQVAAQYPQYASQITAAARDSFLQGANWAYAAGIVAVLVGASLAAWKYPRHEVELADLQSYAREDEGAAA